MEKSLEKEDRKLFFEVLKSKDKQEKLKILTNLYTKYSDDYNIIFALVRTLGMYEEYREKAKTLMQLLEKNYDPTKIYYELAMMELRDNNYEKAKYYFDTSLFYEPNNNKTRLWLAKMHRMFGDNLSAKEELYKMNNFDYKVAKYYELGTIAEEEKKENLAKMYYQRILEIDDKDLRALYKLGRIERKNKNYNLAKKLFNKANGLKNDDFHTLTELGKCEYEQGNYESAKKAFQRILETREDAIALLYLSFIEEKLGNCDEAFSLLEQAALVEDNNFVNFKLGIVNRKLKNFSESKKYFEKCVGDINEVPAILSLATLALKEEKIEEAEEYLTLLKGKKIERRKDDADLKRISIYIKHHKNTLQDIKDSHYFYKQLSDYNEMDAVETSQQYFYPNTNLDIDYIKNNLGEDSFCDTRGAEDFYLVKLENPVQDKEGGPVDTIMVITVVNTRKILSIIPTNAKQFLLKNEKQNIQRTRK